MSIQFAETPGSLTSPARTGTWLLSCPSCRLSGVAPIAHRGEAEHLAATHDVLHHGGRPTMLVQRRGLRGILHRLRRPQR